MNIITTESRNGDLYNSKNTKFKEYKKTIIQLRPYVNYIHFWLAELRLKIFEYLEIKPKYFDIRHLYGKRDRRIFDLQYIELLDMFKNNNPNTKIPFPVQYRLFYLKLKYRLIFHQINTSEKKCYIWEKEDIIFDDEYEN